MKKSSSTILPRKNLPAYFEELYDPPSHLHIRGNMALLHNDPKITVVGSRKMTPYGKAMIEKCLTPLAQSGAITVSGLAIGCDGYAHEIALASGGPCIAVLPSSLDRIYPKSHTRLSEAILSANGLLISEHPDGSPQPMAHHFLARNRLMAALAPLTLVVEAAVRSGALATARFALDLGRDVAAFPGNVTSPYSEGTNRLLQRGAHMILDPEDLSSLLKMQLNAHETKPRKDLSEAEQTIINLLREESRSVDQIIAISTMDTSAVLAALSKLEMRGIIHSVDPHHLALAAEYSFIS